jgi:class 3 adenylate cyclase/tetratricopeptide (TPR) repeat protein
MKKLFPLLFLLFTLLVSKAQTNLDSLWATWQDETQADTSRINALDEFTSEGYLYSQPDSAFYFAQLQFDFAKAKGLKKQMAEALYTQGKSFFEKGEDDSTLVYYQNSLAISDEIEDSLTVARTLHSIGNIYETLGDYENALGYFQRNMEINRRLGDNRRVASTLIDIGYIVYYQGEYGKGISYFQKGLKLYEEIGDVSGVAGSWLSIGNINNSQGKYVIALANYQKSLAYYEEVGDKYGIGLALNNLGNIYTAQKDYNRALYYYKRALAIDMETGEEVTIAIPLNNIGSSYNSLGEYDSALVYYQQSLEIRLETGNKKGIAESYRSIGGLYKAKSEYDIALDFYKKSLEIDDDIGNKNGAAASLTSIGEVYHLQKAYKKGNSECEKGKVLYSEIGSIVGEARACECLYKGYKAMGDGNKALEYYENLQVLDDSVRLEDIAIKLQQMEFDRQMMTDSIAQAEERHHLQMEHQEEMRAEEKRKNILLSIGAFILLLAIGLFSRLRYIRKSKIAIEKERDRSENLLLNILPAEIAHELKEKGKASAREFDRVSILFTDFKGFTEASALLSAQDLVAEINACFEAFDGIAGKYSVEKIKTIGDAYMAAGGLPVPTDDGLKNTVLAALDMQEYIIKRKAEKDAQNQPAFEMRCGIHTGHVVAGIVGVKKFQYDIWGDTVNTASRMESNGEIGEVNISQATYELLKNDSDFIFVNRGKIEVKGKGHMEMWFVERAR